MKKIKVAVWGPGGIGNCAIRELLRMPQFELIAVLVYSDEKHDMDVGSLVGMNAIGLKATKDLPRFLATKPDCVIYSARDFGDYRADTDILMLLERGINVVTPLPYQYLKIRASGIHDKFAAAAKNGGATLLGSGINPGFMYERLAALMTGLSHEIKSIQMRELFNCQHLKDAEQTLRIVGFGKTPEEMTQNVAAAEFADHYLRQSIAYMADTLGVSLDRIERTPQHVYADHTLEVPGLFRIPRGTAAVVSYKWVGYSNGHALLSTSTNWYIHESVRPAGAISDDCWIIEIEGRPSSRVVVDVQGSFEKGLALLPDNPTPCGFFGTVIAVIQAIPHVVAAKPGVMETAPPAIHWKASL